ncbi:MAG: NAD-dependent epimerase/dehydratase family protein [Patescibacteria group bacterium]
MEITAVENTPIAPKSTRPRRKKVAAVTPEHRYLVTGGAGFIGSHVVDALLSTGAEVVVLDDFSSGKPENLEQHKKNSKLTIVEQSITSDLSKVIPPNRFDAVFHLAAIPRVRESIEHPEVTNEINVGGTLHMLEACRNANVKRFIFSSSAAVYGSPVTLPTPEVAAIDPLSPYALQKRVGELYCTLYQKLYGLETVVLRYFNVYGPRMDASSDYAGLIPKFIELLHSNTSPIIYGDGNQTRDFIFVRDVAAANIAALTAPIEKCDMPINVGTGKPISVNDFVTLLRELTSASVEPTFGPAITEPRKSQANIDRLEQVLGITPTISLRDGLAEILLEHTNKS